MISLIRVLILHGVLCADKTVKLWRVSEGAPPTTALTH